MFLPLLFASFAFSASCNPQKKELADFLRNTKSMVVFEAASGMLNSNMDEVEIAQEAKKNGCLKEALALAKQRPWLQDPEYKEFFETLLCEGIYSLSFVPNIHPKDGLTTYVRANLSPGESFKEFSLGGRREPQKGSCKEIFLAQFRENSANVLKAILAHHGKGGAVPEKIIRDGISALGSPRGESRGAVIPGAVQNKTLPADYSKDPDETEPPRSRSGE